MFRDSGRRLIFRTINSSVPVLVSLSDHLIDFVIGQLLPNGGHDVAQLSSRNESVIVTIEHLIIC